MGTDARGRGTNSGQRRSRSGAILEIAGLGKPSHECQLEVHTLFNASGAFRWNSGVSGFRNFVNQEQIGEQCADVDGSI